MAQCLPIALRQNCAWIGSNGRAVSVLVRLFKRNVGEAIDPAIIDRVWQGIERVRPAAVDVRLAVEGQIVRGE